MRWLLNIFPRLRMPGYVYIQPVLINTNKSHSSRAIFGSIFSPFCEEDKQPDRRPKTAGNRP